MWLSKMISRREASQTAESGCITLSEQARLEASASGSARDITAYAPYGYNCTIPVGQEIILVPSSEGQVALGVKANKNILNAGEVSLSSLGGAFIILKNDGSVVINSLVIDKNGVIQE